MCYVPSVRERGEYEWTRTGRLAVRRHRLTYVEVIGALYARRRLVRPDKPTSFAAVMARPDDDPTRPVVAVTLTDADHNRGIWQISGARYLTDTETMTWEKLACD